MKVQDNKGANARSTIVNVEVVLIELKGEVLSVNVK